MAASRSPGGRSPNCSSPTTSSPDTRRPGVPTCEPTSRTRGPDTPLKLSEVSAAAWLNQIPVIPKCQQIPRLTLLETAANRHPDARLTVLTLPDTNPSLDYRRPTKT